MIRTVKYHCFTRGMSQDEVLRALGEPATRSDYGYGLGSKWTWELRPGKCLKYSGELCVDRERNEFPVFFTADGNVNTQQDDCEALNGDYIYNADLFSEGNW